MAHSKTHMACGIAETKVSDVFLTIMLPVFAVIQGIQTIAISAICSLFQAVCDS